MTESTLRIIESPPVGETDVSSTVHGVVLAAGTSSRYGSKNKLLQPIDGSPMICHSVETLLQSALAGVTVVTGHDHERVREALREYDVGFRHNESYDRGQSTSVREGIIAAREADADAVLFALGDMPTVAVSTIDALIVLYDRGRGSALAAGYRRTRGNPVLFGSQYFDSLESVSGDVGGREILRNASDAAVVDTDDPGVLRDVDRPADLKDVRWDSS